MSFLSDTIDKTTFQLIVDRLNGSRAPVKNKFTKEELTFDYSKVREKYHASDSPDDVLTLYKGAQRGIESSGLLSRAYNYGLPKHIMEVKQLIENGDDDLIRELFDHHTSKYMYSALLSATFNPEEAQVFAPTNMLFNKKDTTIYELRIAANRCVFDCHDTGNCGNNKELLILGTIFPDEIRAVKLVNDDSHSELLETVCGVSMIRRTADKKSNNRAVKDPHNWKVL